MTAALHHTVRPAAPGPGKPPVLVLMHGVGSNERDMAPVAAAIDPRLAVVSVRSPRELGPDAYGWFHVRFTAQGPAIDAGEAEAGWRLLAASIPAWVAQVGGDPARVYLAGFSQGGILALAGLLTAPDLVAGAICMSGRLLPEALPHAAPPAKLAGKPVLLLHGTEDARLGIGYARKAREALQGLGLRVTYHELAMGHEVTPESIRLANHWLEERMAG